MVVEYTLVALVLGAVYGLVKYLVPDFPLDLPTLLTFVVWALVKLGVEVVGQPVRAFLTRKFPKLFTAKATKKSK